MSYACVSPYRSEHSNISQSFSSNFVGSEADAISWVEILFLKQGQLHVDKRKVRLAYHSQEKFLSSYESAESI